MALYDMQEGDNTILKNNKDTVGGGILTLKGFVHAYIHI